MWMIGYIVTPTLFAMLDDRMLAGHIAGKLFSVIAYIGSIAAIYLLGFMVVRQRRAVLCSVLFWVVAVMLVCVAMGVILQMEMAALKAGLGSMDVMESAQRGRFAMLHGVASVVYLAQSLLGVWVVVCGR
jgi:ABC-type transport system involved in multi-copper enzyme maturation permease subunit